ncbi:amino acid permease [Methanospirillum purgamenti]|uniref:Amino acid permease n=1 Tax=Methanospirillum hungatei TaxID=2203 RepID=A0A8F5VNI7_METHU|nr:amino acid permease [Methanospirillum hungatei]QXO95456.1 amino acid permease [Methanospirillum hungatei]
MEPSIPKTASLSLWQIIPLYIGSVLGSGILLLPGLTADSAGPASLLAWVLMSILAIPMALSMGFLSVKFPNAGGVSYFVSKAWNQDIGMLVGWFFLLSAIMAVPIIALTGAGYAAAAFGLGETGRLIIAGIILVISVATNFTGMKLTGRIQMMVVATTIIILIGAVAGSIHAIDLVNFEPFMPNGWGSVGHAATLIFWCFLGWEAISHVTEEFEDPGRDVVRGTIIASVIISLLYLGAAGAVIGTKSYGPGISEVSLIHLIQLSFGTSGMIIAGIMTLFITTAPAIAYTGAAGRLAYAISKAGYAPRSFSMLHCRFKTPGISLVFLLGCFLIILLIYMSGFIPLDILIQIPNTTFILTYLAGCAAGLVLMKENKTAMAVSGISLLLTAAIFCFTGWAMIWPVILVLIWTVYVKVRK